MAAAGNAARGKGPQTPLRELEQSLPMALLRAREAAMSRFRPMLRRHALTEQQWRVIRVVAEYPSIDAGELAERSFLLSPSLTRILRHLDARKLISRTIDREDQRRAVFSLTDEGRKLFARVAPDSETLYAGIETQFGARKLGRLYGLLAEFTQTLEREAAD